MTLNKKTETVVLKIYDTWMHSYLHGDVEAYDSFLDDDYHFIGSAKNEEFLNRKDTTKFFADTGDQFAGKTEIRNETKTIDQFGELIFLTHIFDGWFLNENDWNFYARFRFTSVLKNTKDGWRFIYQHFSIPDSKTEEGETIGYDKINDENQELREAITRRTFELEAKNRELEIEGTLERIRAQAVAMKTSSDLLDIVVTMRNEFIKLGHEAHYFWHMMWLPNRYEKAMTSGDGTRIGFVMTLPRHIHGDIPMLAKWEKSKNATVVYTMSVDEAIDYVDKMVDLGDFQNIDPQAPSHDDIRHIGGLTFIMARTTHGEIGYSLPGIVKNPPKEDLQILERFADAFDLAHRRFLDLQKAEQQAREVEIELALERVRSRTMAMQHSDELQEASFLLDEQVRGLGIKTWGCAFNIYGEKESTEWFGNEAGVLPTYTVPRKGIFKDYYQKGQKGESLFIKEFSGKACVNHYEYMSALPVIGDVLKNLKKTNKGFPTYQIDHVVYFKYGYLLFITREHVPEAHDIFKRFANVFEQTYTRFLDLQKAEAQAKEAQIETALERVRSRTMAMHKSEELADVAQVLFQQINLITESLDRFNIIMPVKDGDSVEAWVTDQKGHKVSTLFILSSKKSPIVREFNKAWEEKKPILNLHLKGKRLQNWLTYINEVIGIPLKNEKKLKNRHITLVYFTHGYIGTTTHSAINEETIQLIQRFTKVFEQTYTRFLDLQKAEAQAREAQIEAALERVRGKAMAMHNSHDLSDTASMVFTELRKLGVNSIRSGVGLFSKESRKVQLYSAIPSATGDSLSLVGWVQLEKHPVLEKIYESWLKKEDYFPEMQGKALRSYYQSLLAGLSVTMPKFKNDEKQFGHFITSSIGCLYAWAEEGFNEDQLNIFKRFASIIDLTFRRFLELQKAEAQAREAQIEAALERVRAKSMAMHHTSELQDVINTVHSEFIKLKIAITGGAFISINNEINQEINCWGAGGTSNYVQRVHIPFLDKPIYTGLIAGIKKGPGLFSETYSNKEKIEFFEHLFKHPPYSESTAKKKKEVMSRTGGYSRSCIVSKNTSIFIINHHGKNFSNSENEILKRFGIVFEQTYTRFLDLQKAEAQAREAQIEAALERVRAQSMAMHSSEELKDVIRAIFDQMGQININAEHAGIVVDYEPKKDWHFWVAETQDIPAKITIPYLDSIWDRQFTEAKQNNKTLFTTLLNFDEKNAFYKKLLPHIEGLTKEMKASYFERDGLAISTALQKDIGLYIENFSSTPYTDEENSILLRFAKVFQQTYTRFLDLQKAEAQAREAQIEVALERIRAKTMAMHNSEDVGHTVISLFDEVMKLGLDKSIRCGIGILENRDQMETWSANLKPNGEVDLRVGLLNMAIHPMLQGLKKAWNKGKDNYSYDFLGKDVYQYYHALNKEPEYPFNANLDILPENEYHNSFFFSSGILFVFSENPLSEESKKILNKFSDVFGQTYRRYLDLQKAEAQAREAQIELGLERVRARAMAMQNTNELSDLVANLLHELTKLDFSLTFCIINIINEADNSNMVWATNPEEGKAPESYYMRFEEYPFHHAMMREWKAQTPKFIYVMEGKEKELYDDYLYTDTEFSRFPKEVQTANRALDKYVSSFVFSKFGGLQTVGNQPLSDESLDILYRFGKVFDLTYTRFNDLKKAEAQARESQITASLERVRAATMAMHQSKELSVVLSTLFEQYDILGINPSHAVLTLINKEKNTLTFRTTGKNGYQVYAEQEVDLSLYDSWIDTTEKWKKSNPNAVNVNEYPPEVLPEVWEVYKDVVNAIPKKARPEVRDFPEGLFITEGYCQFGYIGFAHSRKPTEEEKDIVRRFAVEFGSLYQRFLDLQKAEAQAREAQIEVALEKIRSRTMAMQKGEELKDVVVLLYKELIALGVTNFTSCGYVEINEKTERQLTYVTDQGGDSLGLFYLPMQGDDVFDERYAAWKNQQAVFHQTVGGKQRRNHLEYAITTFNSKEAEEMVLTQFPDPTVFYCFNFSHGYLHIVGGSRLTTEEEALMARFTRVFEQTYARFLDLKKAEIQTREAQINLAVERVRAKALAMHKSEEIMEVVAKLKDEVMGLDIPGVVAASIFLEADNNNIRMWDLSALERSDKGYLAITDITFKLKTKDPHLYIKRVWENPKNYFVDVQNSKDLDRIIEFMYENNQLEVAKEVEEYTKSTNLQELFHASKRLNNGKLCIDLLEPPPNEMEGILNKIGAAFDLAYQRFLDLQNAEAQTKESQIQLALERVRAKTMAMQHSDELREVVLEVYEQLQQLDFDSQACNIIIIDQNTHDQQYWVSGFSQELYPESYNVPNLNHPYIQKQIKAWKKGIEYEVFEYKGSEKKKFDKIFFSETDFKNSPKGAQEIMRSLESVMLSTAFTKYGSLQVLGPVPLNSEKANILKRFAQVFNQTYTRFLDLKKAEAQARESKIEMTLERVRSRSMGMQKSEELEEIIQVVFDQFIQLDITVDHSGFIMDYKSRDDMHIWLADEHKITSQITLPYFDSPHWNSYNDAKKKGDNLFLNHLNFKEKNKFYKQIFKYVPDLPEEAKTFYLQCPSLTIATTLADNIGLYIENYSGIQYSEEDQKTLIKFGKVFQQTYTRFQDLKKAEAQAREAQIETALEKVRSRTMAMQKSEELPLAANNLFLQVQELGIPAWSAGYCIWQDDKHNASCNMSSEGEIQKGFILPSIGEGYDFYNPQKKGETFHVKELGGEALVKHYEFMKQLPNMGEILQELTDAGLELPTFQIFHICYFKYGYVMFITYEEVLEAHNIFQRFSKVFEQTYTRFLDLEQAEARARESQIQSALERVRSHSMGMQSTSDFANVTNEMFNQLRNFGEELFATGIVFCDKHKGHVEQWHSIPGAGMISPMIVPIDLDYIHQYRYDQWKAGNTLFSIEIPSDFIEQHFEAIFKLPSAKITLKDLESRNAPMPAPPKWEIDYGASFKHGYILASSLRPLENMDILPRFAQVFEQAYIRFLDLQKAEAQAREAQIETALEKVRSRTLAMQKSDELAETSVVVFKELLELGIEPNRLFIGIIKDTGEAIEAWATNEDGSKIEQHFKLHTSKNKSIKKMIAGWKQQKKSAIIDMKGKELQEYFHYLNRVMHIPFIDGLKQKRRVQSIAYFSGGLIGMAAPEEQPEETINLLERFAAVFNLTYTRFNDLKIAEAQAEQAAEDLINLQKAKKNAEEALAELQTTQKQLIQSEKMASLGELTAGIAHEIQNPLNFVNNFSEVSKELLDEMLEEIENGDMDEVRAIMNDVIQNLEKINHHGKRADNIVKGMLQHSRASGDKKEATDINTLADEYLRLAYHGLRAKDKSFNAELVTDFDESIESINVIPQDIGRVILNLLTNAFYAVQQKAKENPNKFEPTVSISTKKSKEIIILEVKDNGGGMPEELKDKIFQPFFTTKPAGQGTGLGLSMSYDIITKGHGGELKVETTEGEGTSFIIKLPTK